MILSTGVENRVGDQIAALHASLRAEFPGVDRVAVALHDPETDLLRTFAQSTVGDSPLAFYDARLQDVTSLQDLAARGGVRVLDDLSLQIWKGSVHSQRLLEKGYLSSLTVPFY